MSIEDVKAAVRDVPNFPIEGIIFKDITPILSDPKLFRDACDILIEKARTAGAEHIAAIESRGFLFGAVIARELDLPLIPVRKKGKLPHHTIEQSYELEYGEATLEVHIDAAPKGAKVMIVDDLLATGGTAGATVQLLEKMGTEVVNISFLVELAFLNGREKLRSVDVFAPIVF